jgi:hypothetical protein
MCRVERWSVRTLREKIGGMLFERTALSRKPRELAEQELAKLRETDQLSPDLVFRDPYFLDFLGFADTYSEKNLEAAILRELERFLPELGVGFTFAARQKRIVIDGKDFAGPECLLPGQRVEHRLPAPVIAHDGEPTATWCPLRAGSQEASDGVRIASSPQARSPLFGISEIALDNSEIPN